MKVRNLDLNTGVPAVCVPVTERDSAGIISHIRELSDQADLIEWRMDFFEDISSPEKITEILPQIRQTAGDTPLLCTVRTRLEGGNFSVKSSNYQDILRRCVKSGCADLIDIEYDTIRGDKGFFNEINKAGIATIASHHDFAHTPDSKEMYEMLSMMKKAGADIVKLAVMPEESSDVLKLLKVTNDFHRDYPDTPIISMSMGGIGAVSRLSGGTFGSCVTFGADREASAPGQIEFHELKEIIRILDEAE